MDLLVKYARAALLEGTQEQVSESAGSFIIFAIMCDVLLMCF